MSQQLFMLKNAKQRLTRHLNALTSLLLEAREFEEPWKFPSGAQELTLFLISKDMLVKNLILKLGQRRDDISDYYAECNQSINNLDQELKREIEKQFDDYWSEKKGEDLLHQAENLERQLEIRLVELQCQETALKREFKKEEEQGNSGQVQFVQNSSQQTPLANTWTMERRLLGNELKVPNFHGKPSEFDSFWELFEELVHKQPYSNIEKLSILINCCKGDAARTLQMIPRTGESYERAVNQLKSQYQDPRRIIIQMIRKLKSMKQCQDDHRSLRNNLNDVQAIIATLQRQGESVNTTNMRTMVLDTFLKPIQDEMAKKEFDSGNVWNMENLLDNLSTAIRRKEHVDSIKDPYQSERSIFHTSTMILSKVRCTGCGQDHRFQHCNKYWNTMQKIERLRELNACWKCFSLKHHTAFCRKQNCLHCGGPHNHIICRQRQKRLNERHGISQQRYISPYQRRTDNQSTYPRRRSQSPKRSFKSRSYSPNRQINKNRPPNFTQHDQSPQRSSQRPLHKNPLNKNTVTQSPSPARTPERQVRFNQSPRPRKRSFENINVNLQIQECQATEEVNDEFTNAFISSSNVRLMIDPVQIQSPEGHQRETVLALLDSASDQSFISTALARRKNLKIQNETTIVVNTFGGRAEKRRAKRVIIFLYNKEGDYIKVKLLTNDLITPPLPMGSLFPEDDHFIRENFSKEDLLQISRTSNGRVVPELLIGMDYFNNIMKLNEPVVRLPSGLFLTPTFFGPVISGVPHTDSRQSEMNNFSKRLVHTYTAFDSNTNHMDIFDLWKLNAIGIEDMSTEEEINDQIVTDFYSTVQIKDNKIFVRFPWKSNKNSLANNYNLALSRLHQLFKMRERNPQCWKEYCSIIEEQLTKQFIEDAPQFQASSTTPCYYIPHQAVIKSESATTKTRIVLDASSKMKGELSLNDVIHQGPLILPNLCGVLIRSRIGSKIMIADVEKAFHMIHLQETERDAVRFSWLKDTTLPPTPDNLRILRFCRLPFGINASPFLLGISIKYGIEKQSNLDKNFQTQLNDNLYVDNVLLTDDSTQSLIEKYQLSKRVFNNMTMNLRQFITSDETCNASIAPQDLSTSKSTKILGIPWNHQKDSFSIQCKLRYSPTSTKRKVLQAAHSTFDPLGLLIPLLLPAKLFLQDLWKGNYKWDDELPPKLQCEWQSICENAAGFETSVPRAVTDLAGNNRYEIHTFVDASTRAFAAAAYLRTIDEHGRVRITLLIARQRLAPINKNKKTVTIPRLELLALLIGIRLTSFVLQEIRLTINEIRVYSDSQVALNWVQSNNKNGTFVDNRCREIREKIQNWSDKGIVCHLHYIPSEMNPTDCATRGLTKSQMSANIWWTGSPLLLDDASRWPQLTEHSWMSNENEKDVNSSDLEEPSHNVLTTKTDKLVQLSIFRKDFSSIKKYKRILSLVMKFLKFKIFNKLSMKNREILKKAIPEIEKVVADQPLTLLHSVDLIMAEQSLIKSAQKILSQEKIAKLNNLQLYTDENGIIRCRGRIQAKYLAKETQEPILLPENHNLTSLIVKDIHRRCGHQGVNGTLANIRLNYWIPKGRQTVKKCLKSCVSCKRWNSKPFFYPDSSPLPQSRTMPARPFLHVGIDLAGPFRVLNGENMEQRRWVLLSTCMVTRAIHLEIVNNLSALEFLNGLRRIVARRGKPTLIISDNATNFTFGREIIETLKDRDEILTQEIQNFLSNEGIKWKFITPLSPWKGGFYERMVGVMKSILKRIAHKRSLQENEFTTVIPECEAMVNSRPLTYTGSTVEDSAVLRPIDFIIPYANVNFLPYNDQDQDPDYRPIPSTKEETVQRFQKHIKYMQKVWEFWTSNYLLELRNFHQTRIKQKSFTRKEPYIGEVVLIMEENTPRGIWPLALVTKLIQDPDGNVRSVELRTAKSNITRSINQLIPMEIEETHIQKQIDEIKSIRKEEPAEECVNNSIPPDCEVATPQYNGTAGRTRPWLPRRAKEQINYCVNATQAHAERRGITRSKAYWHHWLTLALLASFCATVRSISNTEKREGMIQCSKGGVVLQMVQPQSKIQVCANDYCLEIDNPEPSLKVQFPAEITLHSYHIVVKMLLNNSTEAYNWACPPSPYCEQIACTFCTPMVTNPECWPRMAILLGAVVFYMVLITVCLTCHAVRKLCRGCKAICDKVNKVKNLCFSKWRAQRRPSTDYVPLVEITSGHQRKWRASTLIRLLTICAIWSVGYGCQQVILVPSTVNRCDSRDQSCNNLTTVVAKFNTMQTDLCLQVKYNNFQAHLMKISVENVILRCQKETLYFTQNTETRVQSRKRCPSKGSCTGLKCAGVSTETLVEELDIANNFTGITYCTESCGFWGCSCGFPSSGCLFYRIYHVPKDDDVYEIFQCPTWYETIRIKIEQLDSQHNSRIFTGEIKPYTVRTLGNTRIEVTSFYFPTTSIQYKRFITNNKTSAYLGDETEFSYACSSNPSIRNTSTQCSIRDTCKCNPAENTISCYCTDNDVSQTRHLSNTLPLPIANGIVLVGHKHMPKIHMTAFSIELAVNFDRSLIKMHEEVLHFNCNVIPKTLKGCYNCYKGAIATIGCSTDLQQANAQVTCGIRQFVLKCTREGFENQVKLFFNRARIHEQCRVQCGSQTTLFELKGTLNYINGVRTLPKFSKLWEKYSKSENETFNIEWGFPDIEHFLEICKEFYIHTVVVLLTVPCVALISVAYLCSRTTTVATSASPSSTLAFPGFPLPVLICKALMAQNEGAQEGADIAQEEVPLEPGEVVNTDHQEEQPSRQQPPQMELRPLNEARVNHAENEELEIMHRKINRILGRTDEIPPMKAKISNISKPTYPTKKPKTDHPSKSSSKSLKKARPDEGLLHIVDQRTIDMKDILSRTINGLEQIYDQQRRVLNELHDHSDLLQELVAYPQRNQPGPSKSSGQGSQNQPLRCAFCDGNHHASDCTTFVNLTDRKRRAFERNRCERCLKKAAHMATSCPEPSFCFYCRIARKSENMQQHHSAFCPCKFPM